NLPADGSVLPSPLEIHASTTTPGTNVAITAALDGQTLATARDAISLSLPLALGAHQIVVEAADGNGQTATASSSFAIRASFLYTVTNYNLPGAWDFGDCVSTTINGFQVGSGLKQVANRF